MKIYKNGELVQDTVSQDIFCMSNLRGKDIKIENVSFSFYFSSRESSHAIRVKPMFNPNRVSKSAFGTLELHGDWKYTPGPNDKNVSKHQISEMKNFFKKYKVLFAAVWNDVLQENPVINYFQKVISFHELISEFDFYDEYADDLDSIKDIQELEQYVRQHNIFNMWD